MTDYRIEQVELRGGVSEQVTALINASFPENEDIDVGRVERNTTTVGGPPSVYMAATIGTEIIGFNAFISHKLWLDGEPLTAYQSCWTATSSAHRGKKIFQNLINGAREVIKGKQAAFIFGFPNQISHPLFVNKLGYREQPSLKWQMPLLPLISRLWIAPGCSPDRRRAILQDEEQLIALKRVEHGDRLVDVHHGDSRLWGFRRTGRRAGIPLPVFEIGGIDIKSGDELRPLLRMLRKRIRGALTAQSITVVGSGYNGCFRRMRPLLSPFIVDDLTLDTRGLKFNLFSGVRDYL